ncbi:MAG TPA: FAD-dependent oxidoreductase [Ktedonobacteraceae bacterium]|nr:FAD-dependent oxidoreductase [Ktedonobacteraceae bacterium]
MLKQFSYVVVGNGIAGITAVETLRAEDDSADIAVIADNPLPVYNRPLLKDFLAGSVSEDKLWMRPKSFYQDQQVHFFTGRVIDIEVDQHTIHLQNGKQVGYHRLLLATGARARHLSCPGANLVGVTTLRTVADYQNVLNYLGYVRRVVVIGSGPLAVESVEVLFQKGYQVTHLLRHSTLWPKVLDKTASDLVLQQEWRDGVDVRIEEDIAEIVGRNSHVTGVMTTKGALIPCDMVVVAIGIEPELDYLQESGIAFGRGVKVDGSMRTNAPDIYAAGDVAEVTNEETGQAHVIGHWYPALQQGRAAAYSMLDILDTSRFAHPVTGSGAYVHSIHSMSLYKIDFAAVGSTTMPRDEQGYQEIVVGPKAHAYHKVLLKDGVPTGMFSLGELTDMLAFKRAIDHRVNLIPIAARLFADDFKLTDWLDLQKVPTPVLAVSKTKSATRAKPMPFQRTPISNSQFIQATFNEQQFKKQEEQNTTPTVANTNPYILPIVPLPRPTEINPTKAFLVPVLPASLTGEYQAAKVTGHDCIDPLWMETPLSQTKALTIGREPDATLFINHHIVSRRHAMITYANGCYLLRDLGSKNGTFLNDKRLEPFRVHILHPHDKIRIGTTMSYRLQIRPIDQAEETLKH